MSNLDRLKKKISNIKNDFEPDDKPKVRLSPKQVIACNLIAQGNTAKASLIKAGYSESYASNSQIFLSKTGIREYIEEIKDKISENTLLTVKQLEIELQTLYNDVKSKDMYSERIKVLQMMMDYRRMFAPETNQTNNTQININISPVKTDEDLFLKLEEEVDNEYEDLRDVDINIEGEDEN